MTRINCKEAFNGFLIFLVLCGVTFFLDKIILFLLEGGALSEAKVTLNHFRWHSPGKVFTKSFLESITSQKNGILSSPLFYLLTIFLFLFTSIKLYLSFFIESEDSSTPEKSNKKVRKVFLLILFWVLIKQIVFIVIIPPWQTPDETFHFSLLAKLTKNMEFSRDEVFKSVEKFDFFKHSELVIIDHHIPAEKELVNSYQPPFYYLIVKNLINLNAIDNIINIIYLGRLISSFFLLITIVLVFSISKNIFHNPNFPELALVPVIFTAALPQLSFIGASFSEDALLILFITASFLLLFKTFDAGKDSLLWIKYFFGAIVAALCAMLTKSVGYSIVPLLLVAGSILFVLHLKTLEKPIRTLSLLVIFVAATFTAVLFFDLLGLYSYFLKRASIVNLQLLIESNLFSLAYNLRILAVLLVSFWLSFGWMVFKASLGTYLILGLLSLVACVGLLGEWKKSWGCRIKYLLLIFYIFLLFLMVYVHGDPQGRYLFPGIIAFSILFAAGIKNTIPLARQEDILRKLSGCLILFNVASIFGVLIPVFY